MIHPAVGAQDWFLLSPALFSRRIRNYHGILKTLSKNHIWEKVENSRSSDDFSGGRPQKTTKSIENRQKVLNLLCNLI